ALTAPVDPGPRPYYGRPYRVLMADRFVEACLDTVDDEVLRRLPLVGAVDQMADSTDLLSSADRSRRMISFYRSMAGVAGSNA
ncbi:MAG TPA: hypothetical protein VFH45_06220, partial [Acidimicrobiales bacterium]|nr:hypothetical protein [Acidimicrobiales bacterium]